jgi:hypothetical protein
MPLNNTTDYSWVSWTTRTFTPNYPVELLGSNMQKNQALIASADLQWRPGARYIEFPDRKVMTGSRFPLLELQYVQGIPDLFGSSVQYAKWKFSISQHLNLKLAGNLVYHFSAGGFLNADKVYVPDYDHFNGNQIIIASDYLTSFQLLPYYKYSNTAPLYAEGHLDYHFNGLLTNKIPLLRQWKWNLVAGSSGFFINPSQNYVEAFVGLENILKVFRVDFLSGYEEGKQTLMGLRISLSGILRNQPED